MSPRRERTDPGEGVGSITTFAADASEMFGDADGHREGARQQEGDADDERHQADEER